MSKKNTAAASEYDKRLTELDAIRRIHEADLEHDVFLRDMTRRIDDLNARYERMVDDKLTDWAAEDAERESLAGKREIRPPVTVPEDEPAEPAEPDWAGLSFDEYVKVRPGLGMDDLGQDGLFW